MRHKRIAKSSGARHRTVGADEQSGDEPDYQQQYQDDAAQAKQGAAMPRDGDSGP